MTRSSIGVMRETADADGKHEMGRFSVEMVIANNEDLVRARNGDLDPTKVRRQTIRGIVDPGATLLVLPLALVNELGLPIKKQKVKVRYAGGQRATRAEANQVAATLQGRDGIFTAIVEPRRDTALIGAIVLEALDFLVDCGKQRLVPRDPDFVVNEIE
jgi:predicted aspartyl protease